MPQKELTPEQKILQATQDVHDAMIESFKAKQATVQCFEREQAAHYALTKANQRLSDLRIEMMQ